MTYERVKYLKPEEFKRLCGVQPETFAKMLGVLRYAGGMTPSGRIASQTKTKTRATEQVEPRRPTPTNFRVLERVSYLLSCWSILGSERVNSLPNCPQH